MVLLMRKTPGDERAPVGDTEVPPPVLLVTTRAEAEGEPATPTAAAAAAAVHVPGLGCALGEQLSPAPPRTGDCKIAAPEEGVRFSHRGKHWSAACEDV